MNIADTEQQRRELLRQWRSMPDPKPSWESWKIPGCRADFLAEVWVSDEEVDRIVDDMMPKFETTLCSASSHEDVRIEVIDLLVDRGIEPKPRFVGMIVSMSRHRWAATIEATKRRIG